MPPEPGDETQDQTSNQQLQGLLARHNNDWAAVAGQLFSDNYRLRQERREVRKELEEAKKRVPEGAQVVQGDDLKQLEAWKALGKPDDLTKALQELRTLRREVQVGELARVHKLKPSAVKRLLAADAEIVSKGEGEAQTFSIKQGGKELAVKDLLEGDWKDFASALTETEQAKGPKVLGQPGVQDKGGGEDIVGAFLKSQNQRSQPAVKQD